jgi:hypothetical protein
MVNGYNLITVLTLVVGIAGIVTVLVTGFVQ